MKRLTSAVVVLLAVCAGAVTVHRSFRNGYPAGAQGASVRQPQNAAVLKAPKTVKPQTKVVTNRVVITREQAEKLMKKKNAAR